MLPERTSVLIVGAGPTGLAAAISLFHHGCKDITIVDAVERTVTSSRAMAIHAATLEALESIECANKLVELGIKAQTLNICNRTAPIFTLDVSVLAQYTKFPYVLILPKNKTEDVLEEHLKGLGINVQRPYRAVGIKGDVSHGDTEVLFESGQVLKAQYVIGADGARSTIRQLSGIGFSDPDGLPVDDSLAQIMLADVTFSNHIPGFPTLPPNNIMATTASGSFFFVVLLQKSWTDNSNSEDTIYRIGFNVPASLGPPPSNPPLSYLQDRLNTIGPLSLSSDPTVNPSPIHIAKALWATRFRTHAAIADKFVFRLHAARDDITNSGGGGGGYVFLIGDAAHIHSPAGGQGMNLGLRDMVELGSSLVAHMNLKDTPPPDREAQESKEEVDGPLKVYGEARRQSALTIIRLTKRIMGVVSVMGTTRVVDLQYWILRLLGCIPAVKRMIVWQVSGLGNR